MSTHTLKDLEMPDDEPMVIIRSSLLWICDGDKYAAAALNMYVHWTRWLMKRRPVAQEINAMLKKKGQTPSQDTTYIIYRKQSYLIDDMLGFCSEKRLRQANTLLISKGLLKVEDTPRSISDHVLKYELQIDAFKEAMGAWRKHRETSSENGHDEMVEVSLEADLDETENLPLRDGKKSAPTSLRNGKKSDSERSIDRHNRYSNSIDDSHRNIQKESTTASPKLEQQSFSFTPSELLLLKWVEEEHINIAKDQAIVKAQLEKLAPLAKVQGDLRYVVTIARQLYPHINDLSLGNLVNKRVVNMLAQQGGSIPAPLAEPPAGVTFRADTALYLRDSAKLQDCDEEIALTEAQARYEQSAMSDNAFDTLVAQAIADAALPIHANGSEWLRYLTDLLDEQLSPAQRELVAMEG